MIEKQKQTLLDGKNEYKQVSPNEPISENQINLSLSPLPSAKEQSQMIHDFKLEYSQCLDQIHKAHQQELDEQKKQAIEQVRGVFQRMIGEIE